MTLTARELWNLLPHGLHTRVLYSDLPESDKSRVEQWLAYIYARIGRETAEEVERLSKIIEDLREDNMHYANEPKPTVIEHSAIKAECHSLKGEVAQLKARIAELERPATPSPPKPRMTAGEKLYRVLKSHRNYPLIWEDVVLKHELQAAALELGLTDDPEPPSDGELLNIAIRKTHGGAVWTEDATNEVAIDFRRLLAERDGGAT